jgi:hypothetical protein
MANLDIGKPRFFCDAVGAHIKKGLAIATEYPVAAASLAIQNGTIAELYDGRPMNTIDFNTSATTNGHILLNYDFSTGTSVLRNFCAILNHNLFSADAKIRIFFGTSEAEVQTIDGGAADAGDYTWDGSNLCVEVLNADAVSVAADAKSCVVKPAEDGSTIFTFPNTNLRFVGIQIEGTRSEASVNAADGLFDASNDVELGSVMLGAYYDMPHSPDMTLTRSIMFDGVKVRKSMGGQKYGLATNIGKFTSSAQQHPPFILGSSNEQHEFMGRFAYDLAFSYIQNTDLMPAELLTQHDATKGSLHDDSQRSFVLDVWNQTIGNLLPFIFTFDKSSVGDDAEGDYIFARFDQSSLDMNQVAHKLWNIRLKIIEEF